MPSSRCPVRASPRKSSRSQPTAIVAASTTPRAAQVVQEAFSNAHFRVYTHDDVIGVELGGSLKNVMAVATGIVEGVGLGYNSRAALITRGLAEMTRLGVALGAQAGDVRRARRDGRSRAHVHRLAESQSRASASRSARARRSTRRWPGRRRSPRVSSRRASALALARAKASRCQSSRWCIASVRGPRGAERRRRAHDARASRGAGRMSPARNPFRNSSRSARSAS